MTRRVLVTRPEPGNTQTANRLSAAGFEPIQLPLTEIRPVNCDPLPHTPDAVVISSPNAIRHASANLIKSLGSSPVFAVGSASRMIATEAGLNVIFTGSGDAVDLAAEVARRLMPDDHIAFPCGKLRRSDLENILLSKGYKITPLETYDTTKVSYSTKILSERLGDEFVDSVLFHSAESAKIFSKIFPNHKLTQITDKTAFIALSKRILEALRVFSGNRKYSTTRPIEQEMLNLLARHVGTSNRN